MRNRIIETGQLTKIFRKNSNEIRAISNISITIDQGEFISIMGPSGAGKTTLLHILGCLDSPTSGSYNFLGKDISSMDDSDLSLLRATKIGFVFQTFNLLNYYTVIENVKMPFIYSNSRVRNNKEIHIKALKSIEAVGLLDRKDHFPGELSGGEQQRAAIARAIVTEPEILFADEPTGNLDSKTGSEIIDIFQELNSKGITIIMVTHNAALSKKAHRSLYIKDGIIEPGKLETK
jgi:putative ABC transport system ATP-binding protein